jgi:hypothetical protein
VTIVDNDFPPGTLQFSSTSYSIAENGGSATVGVTRTNGSFGAASVHYATSNGTATAPADYTATSGDLSWTSGETATKSFSVPIVNDRTRESNETINLTLSAPTGASLGSPATGTITIVDDDGPGTLQFSAAAYTVSESTPVITIAVNRINGSSGAASVQYATSAGTATADVDYNERSGTLNWPSGNATPKGIDVPINDDALVEGNETVTITLSMPTGATLSGPTTVTLTIVDND